MFIRLSHPKMNDLALVAQEQFGHWFGFEDVTTTDAHLYFKAAPGEHDRAMTALHEWAAEVKATVEEVPTVVVPPPPLPPPPPHSAQHLAPASAGAQPLADGSMAPLSTGNAAAKK